MKVLKFGGTSVGSAARMMALKSLISNGDKKIVVLSAMAGTTNSLLEISAALKSGDQENAQKISSSLRHKYQGVVNELFSDVASKNRVNDLINSCFDLVDRFSAGDFKPRDEKLVVAQGELISTSLFHLWLKETGTESVLLPALAFMRIDKDGEPDYYYIAENLNRELLRHPDTDLFITQGFICRNSIGEVDNLRRGGSDYTASIIGAVMGVSEIQIWTDISGFHNNDPRFVEGTSVIRELSFDEAAELAYFGAKILHPSTMNPARERKIPVILKNTLEPDDPGTVIRSVTAYEDYKAVAAKDNITAIRITSDRM
ncbi:MAG: aspartate kinase, partial [Bacteroidales bacterium]|nr:aspartate kinase [Bacteroidales bacterium]